MEIFTDQVRLALLVFLCGLLWSLESLVPLYQYRNSRVRHALPNVALTIILVLTNLALSFGSAYVTAIYGSHTSATDFRKLSYGLDGFDVEERQSLGGLLKMPFMNYNGV